MSIMLCFTVLCVCSHGCMCAPMTGWICTSTWACSVCAFVWVYCVQCASQVLQYVSVLVANENVFHTDVAFGASKVLEQDVQWDMDVSSARDREERRLMWCGHKPDLYANAHVGLEIKNNHKHSKNLLTHI